jgi:hypothetical protein
MTQTLYEKHIMQVRCLTVCTRTQLLNSQKALLTKRQLAWLGTEDGLYKAPATSSHGLQLA